MTKERTTEGMMELGLDLVSCIRDYGVHNVQWWNLLLEKLPSLSHKTRNIEITDRITTVILSVSHS